MLFVLSAFIVAYFFAMNIGASGAAASMGIAYGAGAIKKRMALLLCGVGIIIGAVIGGENVVKTIGEGIIPSDLVTVHIAIIILVSATLSLFIANLIGIPLSTSEVTVGAVVGIGISYKVLYIDSLLTVVSFWLIVPIIAFLGAFLIGKGIKYYKKKFPVPKKKWKKPLTIALIGAGFLEAISAGMNNVANAIGPLVGASLIPLTLGTITGSIFVALGAVLWGGKVLETNGKKITQLSLEQGLSISSLSALLVIIASIFGIPMPLTQVTTSAIVGMGASQKGFSKTEKKVVVKIIQVWVVSPVFSLVIAYGLMKIFIAKDYYTLFVIMSVIIATIGTISLSNVIRKEKRAIHEQGGGI